MPAPTTSVQGAPPKRDARGEGEAQNQECLWHARAHDPMTGRIPPRRWRMVALDGMRLISHASRSGWIWRRISGRRGPTPAGPCATMNRRS